MAASEQPAPSAALNRKVLPGVAWQGAARGGDRVLKFLSSVVLARLLLPEDFGLMGSVLVVTGALDAVAFMASDQAIVQSPNGRDRSFLDTVWLVAAGRGLVLSGVLLALSPFVADFFGESEHWPMFAAVSAQPLIMGLANPRAQVLVKDMQFRLWSMFRLSTSVAGVALGIGAAWYLRSAWALLVAHLGQLAAVTVFSYFIAPFRPRFRFHREAYLEMRRFFLRAAGTTLLISMIYHAPAILLGRAGVKAVLGAFLVNHKLARIPVEIALQTVGSVVMPAYSALQGDRPRLARAWLRTLWAVSLVGMPAAAILTWVGDDLPLLVYGDLYAARGLFGTLAAGGAIHMMLAVIGPLFWGTGVPSHDRTLQFLRAVLVYGLGYVFLLTNVDIVPWHPAVAMSVALLCALVVSLPLGFHLARGVIPVSWGEIGRALLPGTLLAAGALLVLLGLDVVATLPIWGRVAVAGLAGAGTGAYAAVAILRVARVRKGPVATPVDAAGLEPDTTEV